MSKEYHKECPVCDGPDMAALFGGRGDGRCSACHGTGVDEVSSVFNSLVDAGKDECKVCSGTGQCQTCGGTGVVYYDEDNDSGSNRNEDSGRNRYESSGGRYSDSPAFDTSRIEPTGDNEGELTGGIIGFLLLCGIVVFLYYYFKSPDKPPPTESQQVGSRPPESSPPPVPECERRGTGTLVFINPTGRTLYVHVEEGINSQNLVIYPNDTYTIEDLYTGSYTLKYRFKCSYGKGSNYNNSDISGTTTLEKCQIDSVRLDMPWSVWYQLKYDKWQEISIPDSGRYAFVIPYMNFVIRFDDEEEEHLGNSYAVIHEGTKKIFVKYNFTERDVEASLQRMVQY